VGEMTVGYGCLMENKKELVGRQLLGVDKDG
jgi:hypothetical protein